MCRLYLLFCLDTLIKLLIRVFIGYAFHEETSRRHDSRVRCPACQAPEGSTSTVVIRLCETNNLLYIGVDKFIEAVVLVFSILIVIAVIAILEVFAALPLRSLR